MDESDSFSHESDFDSGSQLFARDSLPRLNSNEKEVQLAGSDEVDTISEPLPQAATFTPRAYQIEMLEESLARNIIVAMGTGTGKTHIAVMRIMAELERASTEKIIWFLAPTVALCEQQYNVLSTLIPSVQVKFLSGKDNVDKWSEQKLWDAFLKNVRVVVSTHSVLYDALCHAFVKMDTIALLVVDEAHHCVSNHPGALIMRKFYAPRKHNGFSVPAILGLSASPIMKSKAQSLDEIETTLDSVCRTPHRHREDLERFVSMPVLKQVLYKDGPSELELVNYTQSLSSLHAVYHRLDMNEDPYIVMLKNDNTPRSMRLLEKSLTKQKTWCSMQMKKFCNTSLVICKQLGAWAADYFIADVILRYLRSVEEDSNFLEDCSREERKYLGLKLKAVVTVDITSIDTIQAMIVSDKVTQLISQLSNNTETSITGMVFAQHRATVAMLAVLLSIHPLTRSTLRVGMMVGQNSQQYAPIGALIELTEQRSTMEKFRTGQLDLLIATSVLEEGIDIPSCNVVVSFDHSTNLKSFVQRRGRARMKDSKLILMEPVHSMKVVEWQKLEAEMKERYADEMRDLQELVELDDETHDNREFRVERTGALLNLDNAVAHLDHFCALLPASPYVDLRPDFIIGPEQRARVILPTCVDISVREAEARYIWTSEQNAKKDAAFEAYIALYRAGLINDNLLPLFAEDTEKQELASAVESRPSTAMVGGQFDPWLEISKAWTESRLPMVLYKYFLTLRNPGKQILSSIEVLSPKEIPMISPIRLYWDDSTEMAVDISPLQSSAEFDSVEIDDLQTQTEAYFQSVFDWRFPILRRDFILLFVGVSNCQLDVQITDIQQLKHQEPGSALIRSSREKNIVFAFQEWLEVKPPIGMVKHPGTDYVDATEHMTYLALTKASCRRDFLHPGPNAHRDPSAKTFGYALPLSQCVLEKMTLPQFQLGLFIPSVMHRLEIGLVAQLLSNTLLKPVRFVNLGLVSAAITASSAQEKENYQRLEFIGDSILKICTSVHLLALYPLWHEGYLSFKKDRLVSNSRLAKAALEVGLDKFIVTKPFMSRKWRPQYVQELLSASENNSMDKSRLMSTKILADVVEALIGAAYLDGGMSRAIDCIRVFLPDIPWQLLQESIAVIDNDVPNLHTLPPTLYHLETLVGYTFRKKTLLIEALTHVSYNHNAGSLERLEFLGDAVLDNVIVNAIIDLDVQLAPVEMHRLRIALVNADFLAWLCMQWAIEEDFYDVENRDSTKDFEIVDKKVSLPLWKFMRHTSTTLAKSQRETFERFLLHREDIRRAFEHGNRYPWALLTRLKAEKFYSDLVESLLGAIYIDSGTLEECKNVLERIGVLPYLRRIIDDRVHILHPREELGLLAGMETVKYVVSLEQKVDDGFEVREYTCEVLVGERSVVTVERGVSREEVRTRAAQAAVEVLKSSAMGRGVDGS